MKEFISKYQKAIVGTGAVAVLVLCYFQQKELAKLRSEHVEVSTVPYVIDSIQHVVDSFCLLYTSPSPRDRQKSRMPSSA